MATNKKKASGGQTLEASDTNNGYGIGAAPGAQSQTIKNYLAEGWCVVPVPYMQKAPILKGWGKLVITPDDVEKYFKEQMNVGVLLGPRSNGLTDADLDCPEAGRLAPYFMPRTDATFGRASKPQSHLLYYCHDADAAAATVTFKDEQGGMIMELRLGTGNRAAQTIIPPSVHPSGEVVEWASHGEPARVAYATLKTAAVQVTVGSLLMRHWPSKGSRHKAGMAIGGVLARAGWDVETIKYFVGVVAKEAGDDEATDRVEAAVDSVQNFSSGKAVYGIPVLREIFGDAVAESIAKHLDYSDPDDDPQLLAMNEQYCVLPIGGKTRVVTWGDDPDFTGQRTITMASSLADFKALHDKYRYTYMGKVRKRGTAWINNPDRKQYDCGMRFMPNRDEEVVNGNILNLWSGFSVKAHKPEGRSGASGCQLFLDHGLHVICSGNEEHFNYLMNREALIAQQRIRSEVAVGLHTESEGSGKGFWCRALNRLYGAHAMQVQHHDHVIGKHNPHLGKLLRLTADEALFAGDPRHRNALYYLITEPGITIEPKFIDPYTAPNYLNIDIISNAEHFIPVSGTARRFFVPTVSTARVNDFPYFRKIEDQLNDGGYEALLYHLLHEINISNFNVRNVPKTAALSEQAAYSRKGVDLLVETACNTGRVPCALSEKYPDISNCSGESQFSFDYFIAHHSDRELVRHGPLRVKRELKNEWDCKTGDDARVQYKNVRIHVVCWPPLCDLRAKFIAKHGPQQWLCPDITDWQAGQAM